MQTRKVTDDSFESDVLKSSVPVLVDFWAEWCGPCKAIAPALEDLANAWPASSRWPRSTSTRIRRTPSNYRVRGIPTLILFKDGQVAATKVGSLPKSKLYEWIHSRRLRRTLAVLGKHCAARVASEPQIRMRGGPWPVARGATADW